MCNPMSSFVWALCAVIVIAVMFPSAALAYLDPGTTSFIFQLLAGLLVGCLFALKVFWSKVKSLWANLVSWCGKKTAPPCDKR